MKMPHWPLYIGPDKDLNSSLIRTKNILNYLNNPQDKLKNVIHITGTKGKGSTSLMISSILKEAGFIVNSYISPHIYECNERILLNGTNISDEYLTNITEEIRLICEKNNIEPNFFESMTACAIRAFSENNADFNVIEVGMGGMHDPTNVFDNNPPLACVFTPIHLDHVEYLGYDILDIFAHKLGILKTGTTNVIFSSQCQEILHYARQIKFASGKQYGTVKISIFQDDFDCSKIDEDDSLMGFESLNFVAFTIAKPTLLGDHQIINASCAIETSLLCCNCLTIDHISKGIEKTKNIVRLEKISNNLSKILPEGSIFYLDGAHNAFAMYTLMKFILEFKEKNPDFKIIVAVARTKGANNRVFLEQFFNKNRKSEIDLVICTKANLESLPEPPERIAKSCRELGLNHIISYNIKDGIVKISEIYQKEKILFFALGSFYIARDIKFFGD